MEQQIYSMTQKDLAEQLVGRTIASIEGNKITLSNGTVLEIEDTEDCCAWYEGNLEAFDYKDNIITSVQEVPVDPTRPGAVDAWTLRVLSAHTVIAKINVEGDPTSGYYCHSVNLRIKK